MDRSEVAHGFRASFKTWAEEMTQYPPHLIEMCLAHVVGGAVERAYRRGDLLDQRRRLMQDWSDFLASAKAEDFLASAKAESGPTRRS